MTKIYVFSQYSISHNEFFFLLAARYWCRIFVWCCVAEEADEIVPESPVEGRGHPAAGPHVEMFVAVSIEPLVGRHPQM